MDAPVFVAATSDLDRDQDRVDVASLKLEHFEGNPIILANHDRDRPLGTWDVSVEDGQLLASPKFASTAQAQEWKTLVEEGVIRGVSVGFRPSDNSPENSEGGRDFFDAELLEISLVTIPANPKALRMKEANSDSAASYMHKDFPMTAKTKTAPVTKNDSAPSEEEAKEPGEAIAALTEAVNGLVARVEALEAAVAEVQAKSEEDDEAKNSDEGEEADLDEEESSEDEEMDEEKALDLIANAFG